RARSETMDPTIPESADVPSRPPGEASTGELLSRLSAETSRLVRDELRLARAELAASGKNAGMGIGLFSAGGVLGLFGLGALITAAILALALVLPAWAAALIVAGVLFVIAALVALVGRSRVRRASPTPQRTMDTVKADVDAVKE